MADATETTLVLPTATARRNFVIFSLLFHTAMIVALMLYGKPDNSLHSSALAWSFFAWIATFSAYVFGAVWDNSILAKTK